MCSSEESFLPVMYDVQRRLKLLQETKAYVKRTGFTKDCEVIASVKPEHLLTAMALHGEKADIRALLKDQRVDKSLRQALGGVIKSTSKVLGTEGHRSKIRNSGHFAAMNYGTSHVFCTPNLADGRASLLLQLHGNASSTESFEVNLNWEEEMPKLPSASVMRRILAADPVAQARFFYVMIELFLKEVIGIVAPLRKERFPDFSMENFEDGMAGSTFGGCFGDVACLCGPLETQGRGSMHPHMLITLVGHDLMERMLGRLHRVAQKELVQELQRWSDAVLHPASRMRFDCQNFLAKVLEEEADPLPLSENQRKQAGTQYHDASIREVERDGHELRQREDVDDAHPACLTGCYSSLRPKYIRRLEL